MSEEQAGVRRTGFVALAGAPNVGKSTLLNRILGRPLSIATPKPQTTRTRVLGVYTQGPVQLVFIDTPGIHHAQGLIHERMLRQARTSVREADVICWLIDATRGLSRVDRDELARMESDRTVVLINKVDRTAGPKLLPIMGEVGKLIPDAECIPLSALSGDNVDLLVRTLEARAPAGTWMYEADALTDRSERFLVAELVREQLFLQLRDEMPYRVAVRIEAFEERSKHTYISATIFTDSDSSKKILIGKGGAAIKRVGVRARPAIEDLLRRKVYLDLIVKVREGWQDDPRFLEELGI